MTEVDIEQEREKIKAELTSLQRQLQAVQKQRDAVVIMIHRKQEVLAFLDELAKRQDGAKEDAGS